MVVALGVDYASEFEILELKFILPTGQSGQQNNPHYLDQAHLYNKGLYRTTHMNENFIRTSKLFKHLILMPKK